MQEYKDGAGASSLWRCQSGGSAVGLQEEMAEKLRITARATATWNVENSAFPPPALMALLLILKEDEVAELLNDFRKIIEKLDGKEVA